MVRIAPSILSADFSRLGDEVRRAVEAGADFLHIDVMDGHFVPNITIGPGVVKALKASVPGLPFDVHLMIKHPERYLTQFIRAGGEIITVHAEACTHLHRVIQTIREGGAKAGVALNPATPLNALEYVLDDLDLVLIMTVNPGFGGQQFIPAMLTKIRAMRQIIDRRGLNVALQVDGGVNQVNAAEIVKAGADILVAGSAIYGSKDLHAAIAGLRQPSQRID